MPDLQRRVSQIAEKMTTRFGAQCEHEGDVILIKHRDVNGTITMTANEVIIEAQLGLALRLFRGRAEAEITRILERELDA
jgi:putative polyhydroxyalkanoate system protein